MRLHRMALLAVTAGAIGAAACGSVQESGVGRAAHPALAGFPDEVKSIQERWAVPGMAVAVVKDGAVIFARGFGLRNVESSLPATPRTVFRIGSATKSFTALLASILAEEGQLEMDAPLAEVAPEIDLWDDEFSRQVTMHDLLTHSSGLPTYLDLVWLLGQVDREEVIRRLKFFTATSQPGESFQYSNLGYTTAGVVLEHLEGASWEHLLAERIFRPLSMNRTSFKAPHEAFPEDAALPYRVSGGRVERISDSSVSFRQVAAVGPASSISSDLEDMVQWLRFQLDAASESGELPASAEVLARTHQDEISVGPAYSTIMRADAYGLGWAVGEHRNHGVVEHGGNIEGFSSLVSMMPELNLGVVVLSNSMNLAAYAISRTAYDRLLGIEPKDWSSPLENLFSQMEEARAEATRLPPSNPDTPPSVPLAFYAGTYSHPVFGSAIVLITRDNISLTFESGVGAQLHHVRADLFKAITTEFYLPFVDVEFQIEKDREAVGMAVTLQPGTAPVRFTRE